MIKADLQFFGGRGSGSRMRGGGSTVAPSYTLESARQRFYGQTAADVQTEIANIFRSMGSPMNGNPDRKAFNTAVAPLRQLIGETIDNGTGDTSGDYATLLRTSIVGGRRRRG